MQKPTNVGIVGIGYWGPNLVRNFHSLPDCRIRAVCDVDEDRLRHLRTLYPDIPGETKFEALLTNRELDAIVVATSVRHHYPMAKAALLAGKHVLIEKPMATSSEECEELIALAREKGLILMVGHTFLYSAPVRKIKEIVDKGEIGDLRYISARRLNLGLFQKDINVTWDLAPHDISIILHIIGELPYSINCRGGAHLTKGIEDVTSMHLQFSKERSAVINSSWHDPRKVREMTIVGSKRMIVYDDIALQEKIKIFDVRVERPPHYDTFAEFHFAYHYGDIYAPYIKQDEPLKTECLHFLECIQHHRTPITAGEQGLQVVRILEAASCSIRQNGAPIELLEGRLASGSNSHPPMPTRTPVSAGSNGTNGKPGKATGAKRSRRALAE